MNTIVVYTQKDMNDLCAILSRNGYVATAYNIVSSTESTCCGKQWRIDYYDPKDVVTVNDFLDILAKRTKLNNLVLFKSGDKTLDIFDSHFKGDVEVIDLIESEPGYMSNIYTVKDLVRYIKRNALFKDYEIMFRNMRNKVKLSLFDIYNKNNTVIIDLAFGKAYGINEDEECCCKAKDLKWHAVKDVCPDCASKMSDDWRCGPAAKKFCDLLYPNRKYKPGTLVMRNRAVKAGSESGEKIIAVPSYFYAI